MADLEDNPYAAPLGTGSLSRSERDRIWQADVAHAMKLVPWAIAYHIAILAVLNGFNIGGGVVGLVFEIGAVVTLWCLAFVYHAWFAGLLYGRGWGILLAFLANSAIVGLLALTMFYLRARRELTACGWQVRGFSATTTQDADQHDI